MPRDLILFCFWISLSFGLDCQHPKIKELEKKIYNTKTLWGKYTEHSRSFAKVNNKIRMEIDELTAQLDVNEQSINQCHHLLNTCFIKTGKCPKKVLNCLRNDCNGHYGLSSNYNGKSSIFHGNRCYAAKCQECRKCECNVCEEICVEPWMIDVRRYRSDADCVIENYNLLKLEKTMLADIEDYARTNYLKYYNNNKILSNALDLKRKHFVEYAAHYKECVTKLSKCEIQLEECESEIENCAANCTISDKYLHGDGRWQTVLFTQEKFMMGKLSDSISCLEHRAGCPDCEKCYCDRCPRCV